MGQDEERERRLQRPPAATRSTRPSSRLASNASSSCTASRRTTARRWPRTFSTAPARPPGIRPRTGCTPRRRCSRSWCAEPACAPAQGQRPYAALPVVTAGLIATNVLVWILYQDWEPAASSRPRSSRRRTSRARSRARAERRLRVACHAITSMFMHAGWGTCSATCSSSGSSGTTSRTRSAACASSSSTSSAARSDRASELRHGHLRRGGDARSRTSARAAPSRPFSARTSCSSSTQAS